MRRVLCAILVLLGASAPAVAAELAREPQLVNQQPIPVTNNREITMSVRKGDPMVRSKELWYSRHSAEGWGPWQKLGLEFGRDDDIVWAAPEGHWRIYVRITQISGLAMPEPDASTRGHQEFIVDRTPPQVKITSPDNGAMLRGGHEYRIQWRATDPHLHSSPITIRWSRGGDDTWVVIAENIPNVGHYDWTTPTDMTANGVIQVLAADKVLNIGSASVTGLIVDSLAPSRSILGPEISATREVNISMRVQDGGPAGMEAVQLWYSADNGAAWNAGPTRRDEPWDQITWRAPSDGNFLLALVARDRAGNANPDPRGRDAAGASLLVDTTAPQISLLSPIGLTDPEQGADAAPRRVFKPGDRLQVAWTLREANPKPNGMSVLFQSGPEAAWEVVGRDLPHDASFTFVVPDLASEAARIKVIAVDLAGNQGKIVAPETFMIDNRVDLGEIRIEL